MNPLEFLERLSKKKPKTNLQWIEKMCDLLYEYELLKYNPEPRVIPKEFFEKLNKLMEVL